MRAGDRVLVAVSGGADSVGLLRVLLELRSELGIVPAVGHLNHGLRGEASDADEHFVAELARHHELELFRERVDVAGYAAENRLSLEAAGRRLRYDFLLRIAEAQGFNTVATAHTQDDQAETVLLKFMRGSGTRGLAGIHPVMVLRAHPSVRFVRPLLEVARTEVEAYLASIDQPWREDESNLDHRFRRNRVRHELLPLLEREYNPNIRRVLVETAEIARGEEAYWDAALDPMLEVRHDPPGQLRLPGFQSVHIALQRRLLKGFLEIEGIATDFQHIEKVRRCALGGVPNYELPGGWTVAVEGEYLWLRPPGQAAPDGGGYEYELTIPGEARVAEIGAVIRAIPVPAQIAAEERLGSLLRRDVLDARLTIRNWRPGDRYHPAHSGGEQKLKRLFSERRIPAEQRSAWPIGLKGNEIVWVRGFPVASGYEWRPGDGDALRIEVIAEPLS